MTNFTRLPLWLLTASLLSACGTNTYQGQNTGSRYNTSASPETLLQQANSAPTLQAANLRYQAASQLIAQGQRERAMTILNNINTQALPPTLAFDINRLRANYALSNNNTQQALKYLNIDSYSDPLPTPQSVELNQMRANIFEMQDQPAESARALIRSAAVTTDTQRKQELHDQIWQQLMQVPVAQLQSIISSGTNEYTEQGWFELALAIRGSQEIGAQSSGNEFAQWKQRWSDHPASALPPQQLKQQKAIAPQTINRIGLLLPMSGPLEKPAKAIADGFYAALYQAQQQGQPVPEVVSLNSEELNTPQAIFTRTQNLNLDLIVGPLSRDLVNQIAQQGPAPVPVLALNQVNPAAYSPFQLDLASEQEAALVAEKAWQDGKRRVLTITPDVEWARNLQAVFKSRFEALGGQVSDALFYNMQNDLSRQITDLLLTTESSARAKQLRRAKGRSYKYEEHPREDADAILMVAMPQDARQIKAMLAYHYAGDIPVYATSHLYTGKPNAVRDIDLNGIIFCDLPWTLEPASPIHQAINNSRNDGDSRFGRLYAMGADAFTLAPYLQPLSQTPGAYLNGETGSLSLDANNHIVRHLPWAKFENGVPVLMNPPAKVTPAAQENTQQGSETFSF